MSHDFGPAQAKVTVSIGCATHGAQTSFSSADDFIKAADQALYTAKLRGRNRTVPFDREIPTALATLNAHGRARAV